MCGIVGAAAKSDVVAKLITGLQRLEYRGYDSSGLALIESGNRLVIRRAVGKVALLTERLHREPVSGSLGIAHTRWATHGGPSEKNAHPHVSGASVAVVHNGIIENHNELRAALQGKGFKFSSETDTEVIAHQIEFYLQQSMSLHQAVMSATADLQGAYALGVVSPSLPGQLVAARRGSPLLIGRGINENFIASDAAALIPFTQELTYMEDGDTAILGSDSVEIFDASGSAVEREVKTSSLSAGTMDKGGYRHFMLKEIFEQPRAVADTLEGRLSAHRVLDGAFGHQASDLFDEVKAVHIVACGTSYHAGLIARYWLEALAGLPCQVEIASEFRYREPYVSDGTLVVTISQSGETADTLEALREAMRRGYAHSLCICNAPESSLVRESELVLMTHAGPEIGVASTKAFTTQLVALMLLVISLGKKNKMSEELESELVAELRYLPKALEAVLQLNAQIEQIAGQFADKHHALFLGRGVQHPVAMEGALKLKEISYIHAEAYAAGELKHGPLALVDSDMPVIAVAPNDHLLEKLKSNIHEVHARGGKLLVFADADVSLGNDEVEIVHVGSPLKHLAPVIFTIPLQLLSYHVAVIKGTDVDQPRNLAKSVTVE